MSKVFELLVPDGDVPLVTRVLLPDGEGPFPTVLVTGSWLTVKEQMADLYARRLTERGYATVTFDYAGFGASGGGLRQTEIPSRKMANLAAVVDWASTATPVDPDRVGVLAVCASAQYTLAALGRGLPVSAFVSVAGWFHDTTSVAPFYGGPDGVTTRLDRATTALERFRGSAGTDLSLVPAYAAGDDRAGMSMEMDYYANPARGAVPEWRNEMSELTWAHWLTFDAFAGIGTVDVPSLFVHSDDAVLPENVRSIVAGMETADLAWTTGQQTDFYDRDEQTAYAIDAADEHFRVSWEKA